MLNYLTEAEARERLQPALRKIMDAELKAGNKFKEACIGWPDDETLIVFFKNSFVTPTRNDLPDVEYKMIDDPHYWRSEYRDMAHKQLLADGFI